MISICIPCYEMHGKGQIYLKILLESILIQSTNKYEVVISDQSDNTDILNLIDSYKHKMHISYYKCDNKGKSSYNLNNAIKHAKYNIIKPMFQDDFFINNMCLESILNIPNVTWGGYTFTHFDSNNIHIGNTIFPRYNNSIKYGNNTIGCPSVIFFKNDNNFFNNDLVWLMDCEFYEKMFKKYGTFLNVPLCGIGVRVWENSYTNHITEDIKNKEFNIVKEIYG